MSVRTGLDRIADGDSEIDKLLAGRRVGLVCHPASVDRRLRHAREVVTASGAQLVALFGPEHGIGGEAQDMIGVESSAEVDGVPVHSLYGNRFEDLSPTPEQLDGLDAILIDLQDIGSRYYTYVWTATLVCEAAARAGVQPIVLDRPNPLGGTIVEGAPQRDGFLSFVGLHPVPVRHGMTIGELCSMFAPSDALAIVTAMGWKREQSFERTGLPWVLPSPNMPTLDTARVYPGGCLLEATQLSEGRGLTRPFEIFGAPWIDGESLAKAVSADGAHLRPCSFEPTFHKHGRSRCGGVQVHVTDADRFRPYTLYLSLIAAMRAQNPAEFAWRTEPYEFVSDKPAIDLLTGGPAYRQAVDGGAELGPVIAAENAGAARFVEARREHLLYE